MCSCIVSRRGFVAQVRAKGFEKALQETAANNANAAKSASEQKEVREAILYGTVINSQQHGRRTSFDFFSFSLFVGMGGLCSYNSCFFAFFRSWCCALRKMRGRCGHARNDAPPFLCDIPPPNKHNLGFPPNRPGRSGTPLAQKAARKTPRATASPTRGAAARGRPCLFPRRTRGPGRGALRRRQTTGTSSERLTCPPSRRSPA